MVGAYLIRDPLKESQGRFFSAVIMDVFLVVYEKS